jgi:von Willebrand factor A domain-containing protein 5
MKTKSALFCLLPLRLVMPSLKRLLKGNSPYSDYAQYTLNVKITYHMTANLLSVESPSHKIATKINLDGNPKSCRVGLAEDNVILENDFVLIVKSKDLDKPR